MADRIANGVDDGTFAAWALDVGDDIATDTLERICNAHYNDGRGEGVTFYDRYQHDVCNYTLSGAIEVGDAVYEFIVNDGNWGGTEVREWGAEVATYVPPPARIPTFIPRATNVGVVGREAYKAWMTQQWFKDAVEQLHRAAYDQHFQPGCQRSPDMQRAIDGATSRGLMVGDVTDIPAWAKEPPLSAEAFNRALEGERPWREAVTTLAKELE